MALAPSLLSSLQPGEDVSGAVSTTWAGGWVPSAPSELGGGEAVTVMCTLYNYRLGGR